jgi:hypothetical protein
MNLSGLLPLLQQAPPFRELTDLLARNAAPTEPQAIYHAARACVTAALRQQRPAPLLLITARHEMAQQLYEQLALWLPPVEDGGPPRYLFADPDALPYERITWSNETRQRRLTALAALQARSGPPPVVVASGRALMQKTLPPRELRLALRAIKVGSPLRLEQMTVAWVQNGYHPVEIVEEPGAFARRGGLVDIWPPNLPLPVRIDLFGDEVESLRIFDPASQRTLRQVQSIEIGPGSEVLAKYGPMILQRLNISGDSLLAAENLTAGGSASAPGRRGSAAGAARRTAPRSGVPCPGPQLPRRRVVSALRLRPAGVDPGIRRCQCDLGGGRCARPLRHAGRVGAAGIGVADRTAAHRRTAARFRLQPLHSRRTAHAPGEPQPALLLATAISTARRAAPTRRWRAAFAPGPRFGGKIKEIAANVVKLHNAGERRDSCLTPGRTLRDMLSKISICPRRPEPNCSRRRWPARSPWCKVCWARGL